MMIQTASDFSTFLQLLQPPSALETAEPAKKSRLKWNLANGSLTWDNSDPLNCTSHFDVVLKAVRIRLLQADNIAALPSEELRTNLLSSLRLTQQEMLRRIDKYHTHNNTLFNCWYAYRLSHQITWLRSEFVTKINNLADKISGLPIRTAPPPPPATGLKLHRRAKSEASETAATAAGSTDQNAPPPTSRPLPPTAKGLQFAADTDALKNVQLRKKSASLSAPPPPQPKVEDDPNLSAVQRARLRFSAEKPV